ncbi:MAG TPA: EAL domain-containing protein [Burkholderiaceae bacterium]|jgi:diguanylate cyclase (GGDEF)-like protein
MGHRFHLRIGSRLALSFATLLVLLLLLAWLALHRMQVLAGEFNRLVDTRLETLGLATQVTSYSNGSARKLSLMLGADSIKRDLAYREIGNGDQLIDGVMSKLDARLPDADEQLRFQAVQARLIDYREAYRDTIALIEAGDLPGARRSMVENTNDTLTRLAESCDDLIQAEQQATRDSAIALDQQFERDRNLVFALCLTALAAGTLFSAAVTRSIVRPLGRAEATALRLAGGDYMSRVAVTTHDEVGRVSAALNSLAEAVSEREAQIHALANTDSMTGLAQRPRFLREAGAALALPSDSGDSAVLLCFDIDRLKTINAILGFDAGDAVIIDAARRLAAVLGPQAKLSRLAGGTFAALVPAPDAGAALALAAALRRDVEHKVAWDGQALDLALTVGLALFPLHAQEVEPLLRRAEQALFEAKRTRVGCAMYAQQLEASRVSHLSLLSELQEAIEQGQLRQFLQPKVSPNGQVHGAEALVRWCHPQRGWVPPNDFVPFAERTGRIRMLTDWMLEQALITLARWQQEGLALTIAVNLSTQDIQDLSLPQRVARLLAQYRVDPSRLQIELTETGLMDSGEDPMVVLRSLRELGIWLAIDDFGTGHSSLAYLQQLPVHELKIDRAFVQHIDADARRRALLVSIVQLGHSLGLTVTAEGVETESELTVIGQADCDLVQGYLIGKPMDTGAFEAWHGARAAPAGVGARFNARAVPASTHPGSAAQHRA